MEIDLELRILAVARRKRNYFKYKSILQPAFFSTEETKQVFTLIDEYFQTGGEKILQRSNLKILIHQHIRNAELRQSCLAVVKKLRHYKGRDSDVVEAAIKDFSKRQYAKQAILAGLEALDNSNPDLSIVQEQLEKAICISVDVEKECFRYFEDPEGRIQIEGQENLISTGIPKLDEVLNGGISSGDLVVFLAPPERGKTLALINVATAALYQGKKVAYITLEIHERKVARRFDMRISGRTYDLLKADPNRIKQPLASLRKNGCDLVIKDYSSTSPKIEDIKSFLVNYQNRMHQQFDLILIDYADLIRETKVHKTERFGIKEVYTNLRRLANEFRVPIVTASQANRKSMMKNVVSMEDFAEDFSKAAIADVVVGICQTPEELEDDLCRLYVAKNRASGKHIILRLTMKPRVMYLGEEKDLREVKKKTVADRV